jgi:hypothetical protein
VTVFDAGIEAMGPALRSACAQHGGARRVVLGHADPDHRGAAPALAVPTFCHPLERETAEKDEPLRDYWDMRKLRPYARPYYKRMLPAWDGGAVPIEGTVAEGDEGAGVGAVELSGHAPGPDRALAAPTGWPWSPTASTRWTSRPVARAVRASRPSPSTLTSSRRARRFASSPRSSPRSPGPGTPTR